MARDEQQEGSRGSRWLEPQVCVYIILLFFSLLNHYLQLDYRYHNDDERSPTPVAYHPVEDMDGGDASAGVSSAI
jgi:hypothetical protein